MKKFDSLARFLKKIRVPYAAIFIITGLLTTVWFLIRVIPKPTRAGYPCMRVAAPFMSSFVLYLISLATTAFAFKKARSYFGKSKHAIAGVCLAVAIVTAFAVNFIDIKTTLAAAPPTIADESDFPANEPMGTGRGIHPGRVVWAHDKDATDEAFNGGASKFFWEEGVINQSVVSKMLQNTITKLTGETDLADAWDALFKYHNNRKRGTGNGYQAGEVIFIKINQGCTWALTGYPYNPSNPSNVEGWAGAHRGATEATPQVTLELLYQLIEVAGVPQENIYLGDPGKYIYKHNMDAWGAAYPNVNYICEYANGGKFQKSSPTDWPAMNYSDNKIVMPNAEPYTYYEVTDADYLINVANLKLHVVNGISLTAKNHFGTQRQKEDIGAGNLHAGTLQAKAPNNDGPVQRFGWGQYRVLVDIMGNEFMGDNTMLFLVDGLLGGGANETKRPVKYLSDPFNNDWANSIFASQDEVALESVCQDILRAEWDGINIHSSDNSENEDSPWWAGVDDHLHQAADKANWPVELERLNMLTGAVIERVLFAGYLPNIDSDEPIGSLGVHEHWNNPIDRQYSRNLGRSEGIELVMVEASKAPISTSEYTAYKVKEDNLPVIDAVVDAIWNEVEWYAIDQVWLPYNNGDNLENHKKYDGPSDFSGKFKLLWSEDSNLLYMLAEIHDDVFIDGYVSGGDYSHFDVLEVFIDENKSGGPHLFDNVPERASNAFAYHLMVNALAGGATQTEFKAMDLVGTDWWPNDLNWNPDYSDHFEGFAMKRAGEKSIYEFALRVYNDDYKIGTNADLSGTATKHGNENRIVTLTDGKVMGFTVAYCDNDSNDGQRDHFFGSVPVSFADRNESWQNANPFGSLTLSATFIPPAVEDPGSDIGIGDNTIVAKKDKIASIYPNPATGFINLVIDESYKGQVKADLYTVSGALVSTLYKGKASANLQLPLNGLAPGTYICVVTTARGSESIRIAVK